MRQAPRIRSVDIELPLATARPRPAPGGRGRMARQAVAGAALVAVTACATHEPSPARQFRIEPVFSVSNSAQSTASSQAYYALGKYFDGLHEWGRAVDAYRQAAAADSGNIEARNGLGVALAQARRFAESEAVLREAVDLAPQRTHIRNNLGYVLLLEGRPQEAALQLKAAVAQDGTSAIALANLRDAMARSGAQPEVAGASSGALAAGPGRLSPAAVAGASDAVADGAPARAAEAPRIAALAESPATPRQAPDMAPATAAAPPAPVAAEARGTDAGVTDVLRTARLELSNGNGMTGMAAHVGLWLAARGVPTQRLTNQQPYAQRETVIQYRSGHEGTAHRLASLLPASAQTAPQASPDLRSDVRVVLGRDWVQIAGCLARNSCQPPETSAAAAAAPAPMLVAQR